MNPRGVALAVLFAIASCDSEAESERPADALASAARWLWSWQAPDGGWHSETYALLRSGQALTPFVLHALLGVPEEACPRPEGGVDRALDFLRAHADPRGAMGHSDPEVLEYPNYATALALRSLAKAGKRSDAPWIAKMRSYLASQQFQEANGFDEDHVVYGGWGFGGSHPEGVTGHMDLAHARHVLQALHESGGVEEEVSRRAQCFLRRVQKSGAGSAGRDGGFFFSPMVRTANKAGWDESVGAYRSYASATCDGLLALLACGVEGDDERVVAARRWLERHPRFDRPEGIPEDHPEPWREAIHVYHVAARSEVCGAVGGPEGWRPSVLAALLPCRRPGGGFQNLRSPLMKEDDPILCTALAVAALSAAVPRRG